MSEIPQAASHVDDTCDLLFARSGDYYYFYSGLMERLILWARHPSYEQNKEGFIGHHFTLGHKHGRFDIHLTE